MLDRAEAAQPEIHRVEPSLASRPSDLPESPYQRLLKLTRSLGQPCEVYRPWLMMPTRVQRASTSSITCEVSTTQQSARCTQIREITPHKKRRATGSTCPAPGGGGVSTGCTVNAVRALLHACAPCERRVDSGRVNAGG